MELIGWLRAQWDRVAAWVVIGAGAIALLLGWWGVSGAGFPAQQIPYVISGGMVGLFLILDMATHLDDYLAPDKSGFVSPTLMVGQFYLLQLPFLLGE